MLYAFVLLCGLVAAGAYVLFFMSQVPGAAEDRLGVYEALPPDLGKWKPEESTAAAQAGLAAGQLREIRWFFQEAGIGSGGNLIQQVRVRDIKSGEILVVEPEVVIKRRRIKKEA